jgi:hypothetical protein
MNTQKDMSDKYYGMSVEDLIKLERKENKLKSLNQIKNLSNSLLIKFSNPKKN